MPEITNEQIYEKMQRRDDDMEMIITALYGDRNDDRNVGILQQLKDIQNIITGVKFLGVAGKALLITGGIIGMTWAAFLALKR